MVSSNQPGSAIAQDIAAIRAISAVPTILELMANMTGLRFACIAHVTQDSWTACAVHDQIAFGLKPGDQLELATTLCKQVRDTNKIVVIDEATKDPVYCGHITPRMYGFESYVSLPLRRANGEYFGTLCALDPLPVHVSDPKKLAGLTLLSDLISQQLEGEKRLDESQAALLDERETAELREQFIAVLGHDVRTPLGSIISGAEILLHQPLDQQTRFTVERMRRSAFRISSLVDDVLDFARGRMGGGIPLKLRATDALADDFLHVISELKGSFPERTIEHQMDIAGIVVCDRVRLAQLLSNLLTNALVHGAPDQPVMVMALYRAGALRLEVSNRGPAIPPEVLANLFRPYWRAASKTPHSGLGLGLYIASEIARCHGGKLEAESTDELTTFTFILPLA